MTFTQIAIGIGLVVVLWAVVFGIGRVMQWLQSITLRRRARAELGEKSSVEILATIDAEIAALETKVEDSKKNAGRLAGYPGGVRGHIEGPNSRIRELRRYRGAVEAEAHHN